MLAVGLVGIGIGCEFVALNTWRSTPSPAFIGAPPTVKLDDATIKELMAVTNERKKGPAVAQAVEEFLKRRKAREFGRLLMEGAFDYPVAADAETERKQGF